MVQSDTQRVSDALPQLVAMDKAYIDFELMNKWNV
jgi:hypothetical protein